MFMAFGVLMWLLVWFFSYPAHATTISRYLGRIIGSQCCTVQDRFWVAQESSTTGCSCKYGLDLFVVYCLLGGNYDDIYIYIYYLWTLGVWVIPEMVDSQASRKTYLRRLQRSVWIYVQRRTVWAMMTLAKPISTKVMSNQLDISGEPYHCTDLIEAYSRTSISLASDHLVPSFAPSTPDEHDESFIR